MNKKITKIKKRILLFLTFAILCLSWNTTFSIIGVSGNDIQILTINKEIVYPLNAAYIDTSNNIYYSPNIDTSTPKWGKLDGSAYEISIGADGRILVIGTNYPSDGIIYESAGVFGTSANWIELTGTRATKVSIGTGGKAVCFNSSRNIYYRASPSAGWALIDGLGADIAIGPDGKMIMVDIGILRAGENLSLINSGKIVDSNGVSGSSGQWTTIVNANAKKVAIGKNGEAAYTDLENSVNYRSNAVLTSGSSYSWTRTSKSAKEISMAADGTILYLGTDNQIHLYKPTTATDTIIPVVAGTTPKKVAINQNTNITATAVPGDTNFSFYAILGSSGAYYSVTKWMFPTSNNGILKFNAKPLGNDGFLIQFRSSADMPFVSRTNTGWYYNLIINSTGATLESYFAQGSPLDWSKMVVAGTTSVLKTTAGTAEDWWIIVQGNNNILVGKGVVEGQGTQYKFTVPTGYVISGLKYFALGGLGSNVVYNNITSVNTYALLENALAAATNPSLLNTSVVSEATNKFNYTYFADSPSATNSIYTKIKTFYDQRASATKTWTLSDLKDLLTATAGKNFLTAIQKTTVSGWLTQVNNEGAQTLSKALNAITIYDATGLASMLNDIVNNGTYNFTTFQGAAGGDAIFAKLNSFFANRGGLNLTDLKTLFTNSANKNFLTGIPATTTVPATLQKQVVSKWLEIVTIEADLKPSIDGLTKDNVITFLNDTTKVTKVKDLRAKRAALPQ